MGCFSQWSYFRATHPAEYFRATHAAKRSKWFRGHFRATHAAKRSKWFRGHFRATHAAKRRSGSEVISEPRTQRSRVSGFRRVGSEEILEKLQNNDCFVRPRMSRAYNEASDRNDRPLAIPIECRRAFCPTSYVLVIVVPPQRGGLPNGRCLGRSRLFATWMMNC